MSHLRITEVAKPPYTGNLVNSLVESAERVDGKPSPNPELVQLKTYGRDYFRATVLEAQNALRCSNVDCVRPATVLIDARDEDVKSFCAICAYVEFAHWMEGVA